MYSVLLTDAIILTVNADNLVYKSGWVSIDGGKITGVGSMSSIPYEGDFDEVMPLKGHLIMPGLINAHTHSAMILFRGCAEGQSLLTMDGWYNAIREPELTLTAKDIGPAVALSCAEMVLSGTTTFCDQYFFAREIHKAVDQTGLRAMIAYGIVELGDEDKGAEELQRAEEFLALSRNSNDRIIPWLGPHAAYVDNSEKLLEKEIQLAQKYQAGLHIHMAAGPEDNEYTLGKYGLTAIQALERDGFFNARVLAAHCLDLTTADMEVFAWAQAASVAYCATAGLRSGRQGICPVAQLKDAGVNVAIGTDNMAANNSYDMIAEMRVAGLAASYQAGRAQPIGSQELIRMATINGAKALGLEHKIGSLEVGKSADLIAIDLRGAGYSDAPSPEALLIYSGSGRDVRHVFVEGEQLVKDGDMTRADFSSIRNDFAKTYRQFWARVDAERVTVA